MAFKSLPSGIKSYSLNSSNHTHLQSVRKCSFCLMTYGHRKIIWHLFCIEVNPFTVRGVITIPTSRHDNTMLSWGSAEILIRHFRIGKTNVTWSHQFRIQNEVITLCLNPDYIRYYFNFQSWYACNCWHLWWIPLGTESESGCVHCCGTAELQSTKLEAEMPEHSH
jgi:hypothetical protein